MKLKLYFLLLLFFPLITHQENQNLLQNHKTIFITGAAGFIGSNFLNYMFNKYPHYHFIVLDAFTYAGNIDNISPYIQDSNRFELHIGSITDFDLVSKLMSRADFVVHIAAESHVTNSIENSAPFVKTNVVGTQVMLDVLTNNPQVQCFIHISTSEVYGTAEYEPMDEKHPLNPRSPYAGSKAAADRLVYSYEKTYNLPIITVRPFNNYGPHQHPEKVIVRFITQALQGQPLTIHGDGSAQRDWLHVSDHCRALDMILHHENFALLKNQVINIGTGNAYSVLEIARMILAYLKLPEEQYLLFVDDRPGQVYKHISSRSKAEELLGWQPEISFPQGLKETIEWYKNNGTWWKSAMKKLKCYKIIQ
ncbi:MAG: GDP-mannose 4,6-dehydratase [Candidatus Babeliaceae bacterium]